jgi:phage gp36-like protein
MLKLSLAISGIALIAAAPLNATETVTYTYDAQGRLIKTVITGSVNNGVNTTYNHDKADNRVSVVVTGAAH